jgi:membrane protein DedA with SNARE-associated domain
MGSSAILAAATALLAQGPPTASEQRWAMLGIVGIMAVGLVVTLVLLRWVARKERSKKG